MAVKIRLKRIGKKKRPYYRVVVADSRFPRDGRFIEEIGKYDPMQNPVVFDVDRERVDYWMGNGAQPTDTVKALLKNYPETKDEEEQQAESTEEEKESEIVTGENADDAKVLEEDVESEEVEETKTAEL